MKIVILGCIVGFVFSSPFVFSQTQKNTTMNLKDLHNDSSSVQTTMLFPAADGKVISLQITKGSQLKEHTTKVPALLICVTGNAVYQDEKGIQAPLFSGDFVKIEPNVKHWVDAIDHSNLLLIK